MIGIMLVDNRIICEKCGFYLDKIVNVPYNSSREKDAIYLKQINQIIINVLNIDKVAII